MESTSDNGTSPNTMQECKGPAKRKGKLVSKIPRKERLQAYKIQCDRIIRYVQGGSSTYKGLSRVEIRMLHRQIKTHYLDQKKNELYYIGSGTRSKAGIFKKVITNDDEVQDLLKQYHITGLQSGGHSGVNITLKRMSKCYYWPGISEDIDVYVKNCGECQEKRKFNCVQAPEMILPEMIIHDFVEPTTEIEKYKKKIRQRRYRQRKKNRLSRPKLSEQNLSEWDSSEDDHVECPSASKSSSHSSSRCDKGQNTSPEIKDICDKATNTSPEIKNRCNKATNTSPKNIESYKDELKNNTSLDGAINGFLSVLKYQLNAHIHKEEWVPFMQQTLNGLQVSMKKSAARREQEQKQQQLQQQQQQLQYLLQQQNHLIQQQQQQQPLQQQHQQILPNMNDTDKRCLMEIAPGSTILLKTSRPQEVASIKKEPQHAAAVTGDFSKLNMDPLLPDSCRAVPDAGVTSFHQNTR